MKQNFNYSPLHQTGFSLVEIMVGMTIGLLATLVIVQMLSAFEGQKRTTTGSADAQTNGSIALFSLQREIKAAGYSLMPVKTNNPLACTTLVKDGVPEPIDTLTPITITDGISDTITIRYGDTPNGGNPATIQAIGALPNEIVLDSNFGCAVGDTSLIVNGNTCAMSKIQTITASGVTVTNTVTAAYEANLACLGTWGAVTYTITNGTLTRNGNPSVADIVNIQAQYGITDTPQSDTVTNWVNPTGAWAAPTATDRNRIRAVRIAIVAINGKKEATDVTYTCSSTTAANPTGLCAWDGSAFAAPNIDVSTLVPDWQRYRYRVYETVIPLRNMIWSRSTL